MTTATTNRPAATTAETDIDIQANRRFHDPPHIRRMRRWRAANRFLFRESGLPSEWLDVVRREMSQTLWSLEGRPRDPDGEISWWAGEEEFAPADPEIDFA